jgi:hypothetical protein
VGRFDAPELGGDAVEGLVPADALELALAPLPCPLHRELKAVGVILAFAIGPAADAGPELGVGDGVARTVVRLDANDAAVADEDLEQAAPAAVVGGAAGPDHALLGRRLLDQGVARVAAPEPRGQPLRRRGRRADERAPAKEAAPAHRRRLDLLLEGRRLHGRPNKKMGTFLFFRNAHFSKIEASPFLA